MNFYGWLIDKKIIGLNVTVSMSIGEYLDLASEITKLNVFQRRKVRAHDRVYELLRKDLLQGCVIPPITLAVSDKMSDECPININRIVERGSLLEEEERGLNDYVEEAFRRYQLIILDGLQRTFTLQQCLTTAQENDTEAEFSDFTIRTEIYLGLSKSGILYRMLTLNTGQTPMSFRHQIEILFHDFLEDGALAEDIRLVKEVDAAHARGLGVYKYSDTIDMYHAFTIGSPKAIDRSALVDKLKEMEFLESYRTDQASYQQLVVLYNSLIHRLDNLSCDWSFDKERAASEIERPFGTNIDSLFSKSQPMTAFGAELNRLIKLGKIEDVSSISSMIDNLRFTINPTTSLDQLVVILDEIARPAKRIGDAQREYFRLGFRTLFNDDFDSYLDLSEAWLKAQDMYNSMFLS
ncbi:hypothetical protein KQI63_11345 [bacterium]|nr:hypothetical protein [bacterium]